MRGASGRVATLAARAARLRALHDTGAPLVLPNAWDAASASLVVEAGFPAVATTSGGVAASLGWPDREQAPADEMFAAIGRIARAVDVPVTADVEGGYGLEPDVLAVRLLDAGAVGCNLEDSDHAGGAGGPLVAAERQAERIAALRAATARLGVALVINARIDVFLHGVADAVEEAVRRARLYRGAGADCVFPILAADERVIADLVGRCGAPVNVLASEKTPPLARLRALGVARISFGSGLQRRAMAETRRALAAIAAELAPRPR